MVEIWQFWEFEHLIDAPSGLELFAADVFQIIAPALNDKKITLIASKSNQRFIFLNHELVIISTLNFLAIHLWLILQSLTITTKKATFSDVSYLEILYFQILEYFLRTGKK